MSSWFNTDSSWDVQVCWNSKARRNSRFIIQKQTNLLKKPSKVSCFSDKTWQLINKLFYKADKGENGASLKTLKLATIPKWNPTSGMRKHNIPVYTLPTVTMTRRRPLPLTVQGTNLAIPATQGIISGIFGLAKGQVEHFFLASISHKHFTNLICYWKRCDYSDKQNCLDSSFFYWFITPQSTKSVWKCRQPKVHSSLWSHGLTPIWMMFKCLYRSLVACTEPGFPAFATARQGKHDWPLKYWYILVMEK